MSSEIIPPPNALPLLTALIRHARQMPDERLLLTTRVTPPSDRASDHAEWIRQERWSLDNAIGTQFFNGGIFCDLRTIVTFLPLEHFDTGMIATFPLPVIRCRPFNIEDFLDTSEPLKRLTHYYYMIWKAVNGLDIPYQLEIAIDDFLLSKMLEGITLFGRSDILANTWTKLPLEMLYGLPIVLRWADGTMRVLDKMLPDYASSSAMVTIPSACELAIQVRHACSLRASATRASDLERGYGRRMVPLQKSQHTDFKQLFDVRNWLRMVRNQEMLNGSPRPSGGSVDSARAMPANQPWISALLRGSSDRFPVLSSA